MSKILFKTLQLSTSKYLRQVGLPAAHGVAFSDCGPKRPIRPIEPAKVRLSFIPDEWFNFFYNKTGITGPYIFGLGLLNFLFSKEIYVCDHQFYNGLSMGILCIAAVKKLGPMVAKYCDNEIDKIEQNWKQMHEDELKALKNIIELECQEQWHAEGALQLMELKKENIALQLEEGNRIAMMDFYREVKQRLDYQVACRFIEKRLSHKHMVTWIVNKASEALPESDEITMEKRRRDLRAMALGLKD